MINNLPRVLVGILILFAVIYGWWLVVVILSLFALVNYRNYIEIIFFGIIFDALFGFNDNLGIFGYVGIIYSVSMYIIFWWLQKVIRK